MWLLQNLSMAVPIVHTLFLLSCCLNYLICIFIDPGIFCRDPNDLNSVMEAEEVTINGTRFTKKWCQVCRFFRPPRCRHCYTCNVCVEYIGVYKSKRSPFNEGCLKNFRVMLLSPLPPSHVKSVKKSQKINHHQEQIPLSVVAPSGDSPTDQPHLTHNSAMIRSFATPATHQTVSNLLSSCNE
ncbi:palmitoyltransferase ZDHHC5-A-like [Chiloscyllium punctatum]|uniref:palmitoyltransferase ZDHHC5-A-like n=1 Tax=Chiloscyllium punctatum TaxID=137246 RepID=UPI003B638A63